MARFPSSSDSTHATLRKILQNQNGPHFFSSTDTEHVILKKILRNQAEALGVASSDSDIATIKKILTNQANVIEGGFGGGDDGGPVVPPITSVTLKPSIGQTLDASKFAAVYSFQRRVIGYTGPLFRLRDISNNLEDFDDPADTIAFMVGKSFNEMFVDRLYDQTGGGKLLHRDSGAGRRCNFIYPLFGGHGAMFNTTSLNGYLECGTSITCRDVLLMAYARTATAADGSLSNSGLVCNRDSETLEIRYATYPSWDTYNFTSDIRRWNVATVFNAIVPVAFHFRRTSDGTFAAPWVAMSAQISLNRPFVAHVAELLFANSTFDNTVSPISDDLDSLYLEWDTHYAQGSTTRYNLNRTLPEIPV
ncbi:hypothetical protein [Thiocapsa sp. N5-Cardenillas]|uniref:hypothetical protein n=1 Tax=Thiocapsa sp. N5-Cardenillas TaxID=3137397 RepID=UPI0035B18B26